MADGSLRSLYTTYAIRLTQQRRWGWIRHIHVLRRDGASITTKTAVYWTPGGKRKRGRPKTKTWHREVEEEIQHNLPRRPQKTS